MLRRLQILRYSHRPCRQFAIGQLQTVDSRVTSTSIRFSLFYLPSRVSNSLSMSSDHAEDDQTCDYEACDGIKRF